MGNGLRRIRRLVAASGAALALVVLHAPPAAALDGAVAIAAFSYVSPVVVVTAGGSLTHVNLDGPAGIAHNIVSLAANPATGAPYFASPLTLSAAPTNVDGVAGTPPGVYQYTCDLHAFMTGLLVIV